MTNRDALEQAQKPFARKNQERQESRWSAAIYMIVWAVIIAFIITCFSQGAN